MDRESSIPRRQRHAWEPPAFQEIGVSAEATAYMGIWEFDWD